ncbi:hypothetical protein K505DRAFT_341647 [Melanomma pulvis-pyrius CBS 109.77]|uniref:Zn(2)-C6 fungal-type domain-containing protein n=1 Tax=Melanomma pulvis-pyrius CBS 109.77 TaxID=1314802 RepID=A0A6A6WYM0_9PLEO|nr:hypothetical protein K505DRAFT_341647 [Melanomma pulvis-pyrius CBS 109.77]
MDDARKAANEARRRTRRSRGRGLRKTTGCLTCRRRHLKCDEATPTCGRCIKSQQVCTYVRDAMVHRHATGDSENTQPDAVTTDRDDESPCSRHSPSSRDPSPPETDSWQPNYTDQDGEQAAGGLLLLNPGVSSTSYPAEDTTIPPTSISYIQPGVGAGSEASFHVALTPPDVAFHRWFDLLATDAAQEGTLWKSLMSSPESSSQTILLASPQQSAANPPAEAGPAPDNNLLAVSAPSSLEAPQTPLVARISWRGSEPAKLSDHEHFLFENFVNCVSGWIDLHDPGRCFSTFVPHLALHDAGLMNAILALSSRQLSISHNATAEQRDRNNGLQYYFETLHYLQKAMRYEAYTVSLELLSTALIVSTYEMLDDYGNGWERHLEGVFWIQRSQVIHGESGGLKQAVWWAWLRQDVWAAFRERRATLSFWTPPQPLNTMTPYELARRSVWIFAKAVDYCSKKEIYEGKMNIQARIERADAIVAMLDEWLDNLSVEFAPIPRCKEDASDVFKPLWIHPPAFSDTSSSTKFRLHYCARILIILHKPSFGGLHGHMTQQKLLKEAVNTVCGIAMTLGDAASSLVSSQCLYIGNVSPTISVYYKS